MRQDRGLSFSYAKQLSPVVLLDVVSVAVCVFSFALVPIMAKKGETPQRMLGRANSMMKKYRMHYSRISGQY